MQIYILDINDYKLDPVRELFADAPDVEVVCLPFHEFMEEYDVECVVSPANAFGIMDGGYDEAITDWFGDQLQDRVQDYILRHYYGEQPVGTSFFLDADMDGQSLIHTPTMRYPHPIADPTVIYHCMRSTLMCARENGVESIVIPLFGGATGKVPPRVIAYMMHRAYEQLRMRPSAISWAYARSLILDGE